MMNNFNPAQRKAIKSSPGHFIVRAGAGTGKTTVLINKYLDIYTRMVSHNMDGKQACSGILTVTFTKRAAKEMLDRLREKINPEHLRYARISTIDAFCSRFLKENAYSAGLDSDIEMLDEIEAKLLFIKTASEVLEKDIDFPVDTEMSRERFLNESYTLINFLKQQLISPKEFLSGCRENPDIHKTIYNLYKTYEEHLLRENMMDFGKLLFTAYRVINFNRRIKEQVRGEFKYVLVDEYQDTNPAQVKLLRLIAEPQDNFFAVGDEQQSIYGFRGAAPEYIIKHFNELSPERRATLEENYRSFSPIPELVNRVFSKFSKNYHKIKCAQKKQKADIQIFPARDRVEEAKFVALRVKHFLDSGYNPSDIVLLFRGVKNCTSYEDSLREMGVKTVTVGGTGFYQQSEIKDLISMLVCADNPHCERELLRLMQLPIFAFRDSEVAALAAEKDKGKTLYDVLLQSADRKAVRLKEFIEHFRMMKNEAALTELIEEMIHRSGIVYRAVSQPGGRNSRKMSNINKFIRQARNFQTRNIFSTLSDFTDYLRRIEEAAIVEPEARPRVKGVVHLMSIHQSKGLEFPVVFIPNVARQNFPGRMNPDNFHYRSGKGLVVKDNSKNSRYNRHIKGELAARHNNEEKRLLYVAMTRAESNLIISGHQNSSGKISKFLKYFLKKDDRGKYELQKEIQEYASLVEEFEFPERKTREIQKKQLADEDRQEFLRSSKTLGIPKFYRTEEIPSEFTVTQLQMYNQCPKKYFYIYALGLPELPAEKVFSPSLFGSAVHRMLEEYYKHGKLDSFQKMKEKITSLIISSGIESHDYNKYYKKRTEAVVRSIRESKILKPPEKVIFTEKPFVLKMKDSYIKGTIDRVDGQSEKAELIDYKTSASTDTGKYRIQSGIYAIALKEIFNITVDLANIYFLKDGIIKPVPLLKYPYMRINSLISGIRSGKFQPLKSEHCKYCSICDQIF